MTPYKRLLEKLVQKSDLSSEEMKYLMASMMDGLLTDTQTAAFLVALRMKKETLEEITAAVEVMRAKAIQVDIADKAHLIDTCGTGGDGHSTFNISTAAAFVLAAAGAKVAKHGNRSNTSQSGSADVLEAAGAQLDLSPESVKSCVEQLGIGFMFAPQHHQAMRHALAARKEIGIRTLLNILGPLTNPASAPKQMIGVFSAEWMRPIAEVLRCLGSEHVLVVHAEDGLDEISLASSTMIVELRQGSIKEYLVKPQDFDIKEQSLKALAVKSPEESLALLRASLSGVEGPATDIVRLNAGAAIYAADLAPTLSDGVESATDILRKGLAAQKFEHFIDLTQKLAEESR